MVLVLREPGVRPVCDGSEQVVMENRKTERRPVSEEARRGVGMGQGIEEALPGESCLR